jgi:hypothetical protein
MRMVGPTLSGFVLTSVFRHLKDEIVVYLLRH